MTPTREELALAIDEARWEWLRAHLERGGLIVVAHDIDLSEAGMKIASDDAAAIGGWINAGRLAKPSADQIEAWNAAPDTLFRMLVISPYVLIQLVS